MGVFGRCAIYQDAWRNSPLHPARCPGLLLAPLLQTASLRWWTSPVQDRGAGHTQTSAQGCKGHHWNTNGQRRATCAEAFCLKGWSVLRGWERTKKEGEVWQKIKAQVCWQGLHFPLNAPDQCNVNLTKSSPWGISVLLSRVKSSTLETSVIAAKSTLNKNVSMCS